MHINCSSLPYLLKLPQDKSQAETFFRWRLHQSYPLIEGLDDPYPAQEERFRQWVIPPHFPYPQISLDKKRLCCLLLSIIHDNPALCN